MAWDDTKLTGNNLTATEWNTHTTDQKGHAIRHYHTGSDPVARGNSATISANNLTVVIAHGFSSSPTSIVAFPTNQNAIGSYVTSHNASAFTIILQTAQASHHTFNWIAIL